MPHLYRAEADLVCSVEQAWEILLDFDSYPRWNPFTTEVSAVLERGRWVRMRVVLGPLVLIQHEKITKVEPPHRLSWSLPGPRWLLFAERVQELTQTPTGCRYETVDTIEGLLSPVVEWIFGDALRAGFSGVASGLLAESEARTPPQGDTQEPSCSTTTLQPSSTSEGAS